MEIIDKKKIVRSSITQAGVPVLFDEIISGGQITVDDHLSLESENPVQNKIITAALQGLNTYDHKVTFYLGDEETEQPYIRELGVLNHGYVGTLPELTDELSYWPANTLESLSDITEDKSVHAVTLDNPDDLSIRINRNGTKQLFHATKDSLPYNENVIISESDTENYGNGYIDPNKTDYTIKKLKCASSVPTYICDHAKYLTEVDLSQVTGPINDFAFAYCDNLGNVNFEDSQLTTIRSFAFAFDNSLNKITLPSTCQLSDNESSFCFAYCNGLGEVDMSRCEQLTYIPRWAFNRDYVLTDVVLPPNLQTIGEWSFTYCHSLGEITIPDTVTSIESWAFSECYNLKTQLPPNLTNIPLFAFCYCKDLGKIVLPDSIRSIDDFAFGLPDVLDFQLPNIEGTAIQNGFKLNALSVAYIKQLGTFRIPSYSNVRIEGVYGDRNGVDKVPLVNIVPIPDDQGRVSIRPIGESSNLMNIQNLSITFDTDTRLLQRGFDNAVDLSVLYYCGGIGDIYVRCLGDLTSNGVERAGYWFNGNNEPGFLNKLHLYVPAELLETYRNWDGYLTYFGELGTLEDYPFDPVD